MITKKIKITHENGLHMRPAMMVVEEAGKFNCSIKLIKNNGATADAGSMMAVTMLAVMSGEEITITAEGENELSAIDALEDLITSDFKNLSGKKC